LYSVSTDSFAAELALKHAGKQNDKAEIRKSRKKSGRDMHRERKKARERKSVYTTERSLRMN
jgi:hypothetical protein